MTKTFKTKTGKAVSMPQGKQMICSKCGKQFRDKDEERVCPKCKGGDTYEDTLEIDEAMTMPKSAIQTDLVLKAYRDFTTQLIKSFVPADNQDFSIKFLNTIENNPESALQQLKSFGGVDGLEDDNGMEEALSPQQQMKIDRQQDAWKAGTTQKSPQEIKKEKELKLKMKAGKDKFSGGKPEWLLEAVKEAFKKIEEKRKKGNK